MAIYVPPSRRRRQLLVVVAIALVLGAVLGGVVGRATAPSVGERVRTSQQSARTLAAELRVLTIHQEAGAASLQASTDAGADLALRRAEAALSGALGGAPWIPTAGKARLRAMLAELRSGPPGQATTPQFAQRAEALASAIETAFGVGQTG